METLNVSLSEKLSSFVDEQVSSGDYGTASEYVRALPRQDQERAAEQKLERLLLEGLESGPPKDMTATDWDDIRQQAMVILEQRRKQGCWPQSFAAGPPQTGT